MTKQFFCFLLLTPALLAADRSHARSMVISKDGIVSTSQTLASQAGAQVLARGGSAIDAAIAANAVLGVGEPMMNGIGGDLFVIYWDAKTRKLTGLNASGPAPRGLSIEFLQQQKLKAMPRSGIHAATVPGCVEGWEKLHRRFGRLPWKELFPAAIHHARQGFPVTEIVREYWANKLLDESPEGRRVFLPGGKAPVVGQLFRNPDLARALELIAEGGAGAFYRGAIAQAILQTSRRGGGTLTAEDLSGFSAEWVEPIATKYRDWTVYELPPNGQGLAALLMLNVLETFAPAKPRSADDLHRKIEAMKLAYSDLRRYVADPRSVDVPVSGLLSKKYAAARAATIEAEKARCDVTHGDPIASGDTTYLAVVDREGNIASWIQSVSGVWGSGVVVEGMGFHLHNRGGGFALDPKVPNALAPGKRPFHTIIPAFMEKGDLHVGFGIMGGPNQPLAHAQFVSNVADFGLNLQGALEAPRFTKRTTRDCEVSIEGRVTDAVRQELTRRGHKLTVKGDYSSSMGRGEAVMHDSAAKVNYGASSPQGDGAAVPEPVGPTSPASR